MKLLAALLFCLISHDAVAWLSQKPQRTAKYEIVPADLAQKGKGYLSQLQEAGSTETFLDSIFGTNCYSQALQGVGDECKGLDQGTKSRLAFLLTGCHLKQLGQKHTACHEKMSLKQCADALDDRGYSTYLKFLAEIDSICIFIQSQDFQRHAEHMLNVLYGGSRFATESLINATNQLHKQDGQMKQVQQQIGSVQELQKLVASKVGESLQSLQKLHLSTDSLHEQMSSNLALEVSILEHQRQALHNLAEHDKAEESRALANNQQWEAATARARLMAEKQEQYSEMQQKVLADLSNISQSTGGLQDTVSAVLWYAQHSNSMLTRLLGSKYTVDDVLFYGASTVVIWAASNGPSMRPVRLPLFGLLAVALAIERASLSSFQQYFAGPDFQPQLLGLAWLAKLGLFMPILSVKGLVRKLFLGAASALLIRQSILKSDSAPDTSSSLKAVQATIVEADARQKQALERLKLDILRELERRSQPQQHANRNNDRPPPLRDRAAEASDGSQEECAAFSADRCHSASISRSDCLQLALPAKGAAQDCTNEGNTFEPSQSMRRRKSNAVTSSAPIHRTRSSSKRALALISSAEIHTPKRVKERR